MFSRTLRTLVLVVPLGLAGLAAAATDPTLHEVYEASRAGHVAEAQQMMRQVLKDHPGSAKAHFVAAEIDAHAGDMATARQELATAESLDASLSFAKPEAVQALRQELGSTRRSPERVTTAQPTTDHAAPSLPWGTIALVALAAAALWFALRRRSAATGTPYSAAASPAGPMGYGAPPPAAGGGLLGSLASGVAVGAGVVAGEELVRHILEPNHHTDAGFGTAQAAEPPLNPDLGGTDFGVNDTDSWDSGGGGGDDWT